jgi:plastocyanin
VIGGAIDGSLDIEQFMPATVSIREGDSITWRSEGYEGHTVTFLPDGRLPIGAEDYLIDAPDEPGAQEFNPVFALGSEAQGSYDGSAYANSGFIGVPAEQTYTLAFPEAGVYPYLCVVHPLHMRGVVTVSGSDAQVPSPEWVAQEGERLLAQYVADAKQAAGEVLATRIASNEVNAGVSEVSVGIDTAQGQVLSFLPGNVEIAAGERVVFWNSERDFHNVIFVPEGEPAPDTFSAYIVKPVEGRPGFRVMIRPEAMNEQPPPENFGPGDGFGTGLMGITLPRNYYEYRFDTPGTYTFYCTIHSNAGMAGRIVVAAAAPD